VYLRYLEQVLDPRSKQKTIVLSASPQNFTDGYVNRNGFLNCARKRPIERFMDIRFGGMTFPFRPMKTSHFARLFLGQQPQVSGRQEFHPNGWFSTEDLVADRNREIEKYRAFFEPQNNGPACEDHIDRLIEAVEKWSSQGIRVYGFRPPTCSEIAEMEQNLSGMDWARFVTRFRDAGGNWLEVDAAEYATFDGSHLGRASAEELSLNLGEQIRYGLLSVSE
jgi:hypothetical protein